MFKFLFHKKRGDVVWFLQGRMNRSYIREVDNQDRQTSRAALCEVVWVIPCNSETLRPVIDDAFPSVTRDISSEGLSFIHTEPMAVEQFLVAMLQGEAGPRFLLSTVEHCTRLGYGFYQIGILPGEIISLDRLDVEKI